MLFNFARQLAFGSFILHASIALAQLQTGAYQITSLNGQTLVGRVNLEDRSLNPKKIAAIPQDAYRVTWIVQGLDDGTYTLSNAGGKAFANPNDRNVYADLLGVQSQNWVIQRQAASGAYTIESTDGQTGWVLSQTDLGTQVQSLPLIVGPSDPPFFPPTELWKFTPLDEDDLKVSGSTDSQIVIKKDHC